MKRSREYGSEHMDSGIAVFNSANGISAATEAVSVKAGLSVRVCVDPRWVCAEEPPIEIMRVPAKCRVA